MKTTNFLSLFPKYQLVCVFEVEIWYPRLWQRDPENDVLTLRERISGDPWDLEEARETPIHQL